MRHRVCALLLLACSARAQRELPTWFFAAASGDVFQLETIMAGGQDIDEKTRFGYNSKVAGTTALMFAVSASRLPAVQWLLENGASVAASDTNGNSPLHLIADTATEQQAYAMAELLLQYGANKNKRNNMDYTPFMTISIRQTESEYRPGYTAQDLASFAGLETVVRLLGDS